MSNLGRLLPNLSDVTSDFEACVLSLPPPLDEVTLSSDFDTSYSDDVSSVSSNEDESRPPPPTSRSIFGGYWKKTGHQIPVLNRAPIDEDSDNVARSYEQALKTTEGTSFRKAHSDSALLLQPHKPCLRRIGSTASNRSVSFCPRVNVVEFQHASETYAADGWSHHFNYTA